MDRDETIALFLRGRDAWNAWAGKMLGQRKALEEGGGWAAEKDWLGRLEPKNEATRAWIEAASASFSDTAFETPAWPRLDASAKAVQLEENSVDFTGFIFPGDALFERTVFAGDASFRGAAFSGAASFERASFSGGAFFHGATFRGPARFYRAVFNGPGWFENATFRESASFEGALFRRALNFRGAEALGALFAGRQLFSAACTRSHICEIRKARSARQGGVCAGHRAWSSPPLGLCAGLGLDGRHARRSAQRQIPGAETPRQRAA